MPQAAALFDHEFARYSLSNKFWQVSRPQFHRVLNTLSNDIAWAAGDYFQFVTLSKKGALLQTTRNFASVSQQTWQRSDRVRAWLSAACMTDFGAPPKEHIYLEVSGWGRQIDITCAPVDFHNGVIEGVDYGMRLRKL